MKKLSLLLVVAAIFSQFTTNALAQSPQVNSAAVAYKNFTQYNELKDLEIAKTKIDAAFDIIEEKAEGEVKSKVLDKANWYQALIYSALGRQTEKAALSEGAFDIAYPQLLSIAQNKNSNYKKDATNQLMLMDGIFYNKGVEAYEAKDYESAYTNFIKAEEMKNFINSVNKIEAIDTISIVAIALAAEKTDRKKEAIERYENLVELNYNDASVYTTLANYYRQDGKDKEATEIIALGKERFPDNKTLAIEELNTYITSGKSDEALNLMIEAIEKDPENPSLYYTLGTTYDNLGNEKEAIANYEKAIEKDADFFNAYYNLGTLYFNKAADISHKLGNENLSDAQYNALIKEQADFFNQALPYFEKAHKLKETDRATLDVLKTIYANLGDYDKSNYYKGLLNK